MIKTERNVSLEEFLETPAVKGNKVWLPSDSDDQRRVDDTIRRANRTLRQVGSVVLFIERQGDLSTDTGLRERLLLKIANELQDICIVEIIVSADKYVSYALLKLNDDIPLKPKKVYKPNPYLVVLSEEEQDIEQRTDFNGKLLEVGSAVIHIHGKSLRRAVVVDIIPYRKGQSFVPRIGVSGLKARIFAHAAIRQ